MKGDFEVELKSDYCNYKFTIKRKITILTGDSAAGKSYLISLINHLQNSEDEGIRCKYTINTAIDWKTVQWIFNTLESKEQQISFLRSRYKDILFIIDEDFKWLHTPEFARFVRDVDCFFLIITREALDNLPYGITEIYRLIERKHVFSFQPIYDQMLHIDSSYDLVICEDSNSGYDLYSKVFPNVISANGKSKIKSIVQATAKNKKTLIIFDAAAFGSEIKKLLDVLNDKHYDCDLFTPESFEWLICAAGIIDSDKINEAISDPYNNIDGTYFSWERFYTDLLQRETEVLENVYTKSKLNVCYYKPCCCKGKKQFHCNIKQGVNKINSILGRFMIGKQQDMNLF